MCIRDSIHDERYAGVQVPPNYTPPAQSTQQTPPPPQQNQGQQGGYQKQNYPQHQNMYNSGYQSNMNGPHGMNNPPSVPPVGPQSGMMLSN